MLDGGAEVYTANVLRTGATWRPNVNKWMPSSVLLLL